MKKIIIIAISVFIGMGILGQVLMATGQIPKKAGEKPKPTPTITKTITPKPNIDPWTQYTKYKVDWREYPISFELLLKDTFDQKNCQGMQEIFNVLVSDNKDHAQIYGHNNVNMMSFVDYLLKQANCYK